MKNFFHRLARWLRRKSAPSFLPGSSSLSAIDAYRRHRAPTGSELLDELKGTAWSCASINAAVCAAFPPRLYVATGPNEAPPKCLTRALDAATHQKFLASPRASLRALGVQNTQVQEVVEHPLLTLFRQVNPVHNAFDL